MHCLHPNIHTDSHTYIHTYILKYYTLPTLLACIQTCIIYLCINVIPNLHTYKHTLQTPHTYHTTRMCMHAYIHAFIHMYILYMALPFPYMTIDTLYNIHKPEAWIHNNIHSILRTYLYIHMLTLVVTSLLNTLHTTYMDTQSTFKHNIYIYACTMPYNAIHIIHNVHASALP